MTSDSRTATTANGHKNANKMKPRILTCTVLSVLTTWGAASQLPDEAADTLSAWTLRRCIEYARANNIEIRQQELAADDAALARQQARLDYIPSVSASVGTSFSVGRILDPTTYEFRENSANTDMNASLTAGTELFGGMRKYHRMKKADLNLQTVLLQVEKARNDLELNITAAFLDVLFADENAEIARQHTATLTSQAEHTAMLVEAGRSTIGDLLQIQSELADAEYEQADALNTLSLAYFKLSQLLEIDDWENLRIAVPDSLDISPSMLPSSPDEVLAMAQQLPQVEAADLSIEMADRDISIAKAALYPSLNLAAGYGSSFSDGRTKPNLNNPTTYVRYPFKEQMRDNASYYISLSLEIPIFNSLSARNNVQTYRTAKRRAEYDYMIMQKELANEIRQAYIDASGAYEQYNAARKNVATAEEAFRIVEEKFNRGAASPVDYNVALYNMTNSRSQLAQAKYRFVFRTKILDFYKGIPIEL